MDFTFMFSSANSFNVNLCDWHVTADAESEDMFHFSGCVYHDVTEDTMCQQCSPTALPTVPPSPSPTTLHPSLSPTFSAAPTIEESCTDKNTNCDYWAGIGECSTNPGYMLTFCAKSCSQCSPLCFDTDGWVDLYGDSCEYYIEYGCDFAENWAVDGVSALQACCVCRNS